MRSRFAMPFLLLAGLVSWSPPAMVNATGKPDAKEITKHIEDFCQESDPLKQAALVKRLAEAGPKNVAKAIKPMLGTEESRPKLLALIAELELDGMQSELKPLLDSSLEKQAALAMLASSEKNSEEFLLKRWNAAGTDSPSFENLRQAFLQGFLSGKSLQELHEALVAKKTEPDRRKTIEAVLRYQMALNDAEVAQLATGWNGLHATFLLRTQKFASTGRDLLKERIWNLPDPKLDVDEEEDPRKSPDGDPGGQQGKPADGSTAEEYDDAVDPYRDRILLRPSGFYSATNLALKACKVRVYLMVLEGDKCSVGLAMKGNINVGPFKNGSLWETPQSTSQAKVPSALGKWHEVLFELSGDTLTVSLDGKAMSSGNYYGGTATGIQFSAGGARVLIGGVFRE